MEQLDTYSWLDRYQGNFSFQVQESLHQGADPFVSHSTSSDYYREYNTEGTLFRLRDNYLKISIRDWSSDTMIVDKDKKFYGDFDQAGNCNTKNHYLVSGEFITKDSIELVIYNDWYTCSYMSGNSKKTMHGSRL